LLTVALSNTSLGLSLTDTLDDLINEGRIEPQLAMKILSTFDRVITEVLADKVRTRLTFKVHHTLPVPDVLAQAYLDSPGVAFIWVIRC
jgi:hypothetical protein